MYIYYSQILETYLICGIKKTEEITATSLVFVIILSTFCRSCRSEMNDHSRYDPKGHVGDILLTSSQS